MKVIDLLEKVYIEDIEYIDIFSEDDDGLCGVLHPERWRELLPEKVLNSEVFKFSPNDTSSEPGLNIYIKDEERDSKIFTEENRNSLLHSLEGLHEQFVANEKKHDDGVDTIVNSLLFTKDGVEKYIFKKESFIDKVNKIIKDNQDIVIQISFADTKTCVIVANDKQTDYRNLWAWASEEDILDVIKDLIRLVKEKEDK